MNENKEIGDFKEHISLPLLVGSEKGRCVLPYPCMHRGCYQDLSTRPLFMTHNHTSLLLCQGKHSFDYDDLPLNYDDYPKFCPFHICHGIVLVKFYDESH